MTRLKGFTLTLLLFIPLIFLVFLNPLPLAEAVDEPTTITPTWTFTSPTGMLEYPGFTNYTYDGLEFKVRGWEQFCEATDGTESVTAKPYDGSQYPLNMSGEGANTRWLGWITTNIGSFLSDEIIWADTSEDSAYNVWSMLQNGILNMYYDSVPSGHQYKINCTTNSNWSNSSNSLFTVGDIRCRVITGTPVNSSTMLTVSAVSSVIHIALYNRTFFDDKTINEVGAVDGTHTDEVVNRTSYYEENCLHVNLTDPGISSYLCVNPSSTLTIGLQLFQKEALLSPNNKFIFGLANSSNSNEFVNLPMMLNPAKIIKASQRVQRQWLITGRELVEDGNCTIGQYVFKWYGFADTSIKSVNRIADEITFKYYASYNALLVHFPISIGDQSEHTTSMQGIITSEVIWTFKDYEWSECFSQYVNKTFDIDGEEGNAVSGGWAGRLFGSATPGDNKYRNNTGGWETATPTSSWNWRNGTASYNLMNAVDDERLYIQYRYWNGTFEGRTKQVCDIRLAGNKQENGYQPQMLRSDSLVAGNIIEASIRLLWENNSTAPADAECEAVWDTIDLTGSDFIRGAVNIANSSAFTNASYDSGYDSDGNPQLFYMFDSNSAPTNEGVTITNMDNATILYAQKRDYLFQGLYNDSDASGSGLYHELDFMMVSFTDGSTWVNASFQVPEDSWSLVSGDSVADLVTGSCSNSTSGNQVTVTFAIRLEWDITSASDIELYQFCNDTTGEEDSWEVKQTNYADIETDLVTTFSIDDDRGDLSQSITASGQVTYPIGTEVYTDNETMWDYRRSGTGSYDLTKSEETSEVKEGTSSLKMVMGSGSYDDVGVRHIYGTAKDFSGYNDWIRFWIYGANTGLTIQFEFASASGWVHFDTTDNWSGWNLLSINKTDPDQEGGVFDDSSVTAVTVWYRDITTTFTSYLDQIVLISTPPDAEFTSVSVYDSSNNDEGTDSTVVDGAWSITFSAPSSVGIDTYNLYVNMSDADYTDAEETSPTDTFITDQIVAYWEQLDDSRVNVDSNIEWRIRAVLDYDDHVVGSGDSLGSPWGALTWDAVNTWWDISHQEATVTAVTISLTSGSEVTYGITSFSENITETSGVYDRIKILTLVADPERILVGHEILIYATAELEYDSHGLGSGDSLTIESLALTWDSADSRFEALVSEEAVTTTTYYTFTSGSEATYGITAGNMDGKSTEAVWYVDTGGGGGDNPPVDPPIIPPVIIDPGWRRSVNTWVSNNVPYILGASLIGAFGFAYFYGRKKDVRGPSQKAKDTKFKLSVKTTEINKKNIKNLVKEAKKKLKKKSKELVEEVEW